MADSEYDLVVIGGGSGGVRCARFAATYGARVLLVEQGRLGGTCVNVGCVPKKLLAYGAHHREDVEDMRAYGWQSAGEPVFDWPTLKRAKDREIERLNGVYARLLQRAGVEVRRGHAIVAGPHTVRIDGDTVNATSIVVATGGRPLRPPVPWAELAWVSDDLFHLEQLPKRIVILGGGYIGTEFASILHGFGVETHLVIRGDLPLRGFDQDVRHELANELRKRGIHLRLGCDVADVVRSSEGGLAVTCTSGDIVPTDAVLLAVGRVPNIEGLGLAEVGVALGAYGAVVVDDVFRTSVPSIYAIGDVIDRLALTPVALAEGMIVAGRLFGGAEKAMDYRNIPTAVFTSPQVSVVGLSEASAREAGPVRIFKSRFRSLKDALTGRDAHMLVKVVVDAVTDRVLGVHVVGPDAPEIVQGFAVALQCGVTKAQLDSTIGIHPTSAEELVTLRTEWTGVA